MSRAIHTVKAHVPLIKFPLRAKWTPKLPEGAVQSATSLFSKPKVTTSEPDTIEVFRVVPQRFRRRPIDINEIEYIERGGPE